MALVLFCHLTTALAKMCKTKPPSVTPGVTPSVTTSVTPGDGCLEGFVSLSTGCYYFSKPGSEDQQFGGARKYCLSKGSHLAMVETEEELDALSDYLLSINYNWLLRWRVDGEKVTVLKFSSPFLSSVFPILSIRFP